MTLSPLKEKIIRLWDIANRTDGSNAFLGQSSLFDNALAVIEDTSIDGGHIKDCFDKNKIVYVSINNPQNNSDFLSNLHQANKEGKTFVIYLDCDPHPDIISILKQLAETNEYVDENDTDQQLNKETRILVCAKRKLIEEKISYPYFYNLFGPVIII